MVGGQVLPLQKGVGGEIVSAILKGATTIFGVVLTWQIEHLASLKGRKFPPFRRGGGIGFTLSLGGGGAQNVSDL